MSHILVVGKLQIKRKRDSGFTEYPTNTSANYIHLHMPTWYTHQQDTHQQATYMSIRYASQWNTGDCHGLQKHLYVWSADTPQVSRLQCHFNPRCPDCNAALTKVSRLQYHFNSSTLSVVWIEGKDTFWFCKQKTEPNSILSNPNTCHWTCQQWNLLLLTHTTCACAVLMSA